MNLTSKQFLLFKLQKLEKINWQKILDEPEPEILDGYSENVNKVKALLEKRKPNKIGRLFGGGKRFSRKTEVEVAKAQKLDLEVINESRAINEEWKRLNILAKRVLSKEKEAYKEVIAHFEPFDDIKEFGSKIDIWVNEKFLVIDFFVHSESVIPKQSKTLTKTGKVSTKNIPKSRFNEMYQDYVCGCVLRLAVETYAFLPVQLVQVNAIGALLNSSTGHLEDTPILSVILPEDTISRLNLDRIDPSDSMENFVHNMSFSKTKGFQSVEKLEIDKFIK